MSVGGSRRRARGALARSLLALLLFFVGSGEPAHAADPITPGATSSPAGAGADEEARRADAKRRFLRGLELAKAGQWDAALAEFTASLELHRTRVASRNMAIALHQLGRNAEALDAYTALLEEFSSSMPPDELERVKEELAAVRPLVGEIEVTSSEPGSIVVVDGRQRGTTPLTASLRVDAGTRTVRVSREGFETYEERVSIAGGQKKVVRAPLRRSSATGTLVVQEASGAVLDVLVDGAVVGKTPWRGVLGAGSHNVVLRGGGDLGTPPSSAVVKVGETATLTLGAVKLDAAIRVEPTPSNATVFVDGVSVGSGVWEGRLSAGRHLIELTADGHEPFRREVTLEVGRSELLRVALERDLSSPLWKGGFVPHLYVEAFGGVALAGSLGGSASEACDSRVSDPSGDEGPGCTDRSRPFGFLVGARGGYAIVEGLGLEVELGYLTISESMTRRIHALGEPHITELFSDEYHDETRLAGPHAALAASYRVFETTPLTFRVAVGVARLRSATENDGTFQGAAQANPTDPVSTFDLPLSIPERAESLWAPFVRPEIRFGYRFSSVFSIDAGLGVLVLVPAEKLRTASSGYGGELRGAAMVDPVPTNEGGTVVPGTVRLPRETVAGTFVAAVPTLGLRVDF
jgi:hypothetical protein